MMTLAFTCAQFEAHLPEYLEPDGLDLRLRARADVHRTECARCQSLVSELEDITAQAAVLPPLTPSRDLWPAVAEHLETRVVALPTAAHRASERQGPRTIRLEWFAAAAAALVAVTAGTTWRIARSTPATVPVVVAQGPVTVTPVAPPAITAGTTPASTTAADSAPVVTPAPATRATAEDPASGMAARGPAFAVARTVSRTRIGEPASGDLTREIATLRLIVRARYSDLDSTTVAVIKRNLQIIDGAIADSRRALQQDPGSSFLAEQLDRALARKVELMRQAALLERGS
jgi:hypothetical protein